MNRSVSSWFGINKPGIFFGIILSSFCANQVLAQCTSPPIGLVAWWPGNGNANDTAGNNHGTLVGTMFTIGKVAQAFNFELSTNSAYVLVPASSTMDVSAGAGLTVEAWINPADLSTAGPIVEWALNGAYAVHFYANTLSSGRLYANLVGAGGDEHTIETPTSVLTANTYQHVALTYDKASGVARLFRNGVIVQESNVGTIATLRTSSDLYIGHRPITSPGGGFTFRGQIDEVSIYNRALSSAEIQSIHLADSAGKCILANPSACAPPPAGLVGWWPANGSANDIAGTNNGTFVNASFSTGQVAQAFSFDGSGNHVRVPASSTLDVGASNGLTIEAWIKPADLTTQGPIMEWAVNGAYAVHFYVNAPSSDGRLYADLVSVSGDDYVIQTAANVLNPNAYQHVALTYDKASGVARLLRNGVIVQESNFGSTGTLRTSTDLYIGHRPASSLAGPLSFKGNIDEVSLYSRALTVGELQAIYNAGSAGKCTPTPPPTCAPPSAGLVSWFTGNGNAGDLAGTNNGIFANPNFGSGKVGQAFNFDGSGNHVRIPASASLDVGLGNGLTVEAWVNPADVAASRPIVEWAVNSDYAVHLYVGTPNPGQIYASIFGTDGNANVIQSGSGIVQANAFQHLAVTYDKASGIGRVYRNGAVVGESSLGQFTPRTSSDLYIGYRPAGSPYGPVPFLGQIDEVSIYSRALAPSEIQAIYDGGAYGKCPPGPFPIILAQPASQTVTVGGTATFSVTASSSSPLTYQWRLDGTNLIGANSSSLVLVNVQLADAGIYSVAVSNSAGGLITSNAVLTVNPPPPCAPPPAGLVSWWPGNADAIDFVSGNTGTFVGASFAAGKVGQAFSFDGSGNYVRIPASSSLDVGAGNGLTVEAWVNPDDLNSTGPIVEWALNGAYAVHLYANALNPGYIYASLFGTDGLGHVIQSAGSVLSPNVFQHVGLTYDRATGLSRLFLNGVMIQEVAQGSFTPRTAADLYIGYRPSTSPSGPISFKGKIDEVSIYSRALAPAEIQAIYNASVSGKCVVPIAPFVISQPQNQLVAEGANVTFSVAAGGTPPLSYQWSLNGSPLANATNASLNLTGVTASQAGDYSVLVTNLHGQVTSSNATLTVRVLGPNLFDDFDPEVDTMQWAGFGGTVRATNYGGFISASNSLWFGGSGSRFATTRSLNTANGALIQFYLRLANGTTPGVWERPELPGDGIVLEYSTNNVNWVQLGRYDTTSYTNWTSVSVVVPAAAQTTNTQFRWRQLANNGSSSDHWALDNVAVTTGPVAPFITSQPQQLTVGVGETANFSVTAYGTLPLSYQWRFNETNVIAGATNSSLVLTNVQLSAAGTYSVVVTNVSGAVTSSNAVLTVNPPPPCVTPPVGLVSWWPGNGSSDDVIGANHGSFVNPSYSAGRVGQAFNFDGTGNHIRVPASATFNPGTGSGLTIEAWINPADLTTAGPIAEWAVSGDYAVHFYANINAGPGHLYADVVGISGDDHVIQTTTGVLSPNIYQHVALTYDKASGVARFYRNGVIVREANLGTIATLRTDTDLYLGHRPAFSPAGPVSFKGSIDEVSIYDRALSTTELQAIYNAGGSGKCSGPYPPQIVSQPQHQTVVVGQTATFSVMAYGTLPLSYQWRFNETNVIAGATNNSLVMTNVQLAAAGTYSVVVTNVSGTITSSNAVLTVNLPPALVAVTSLSAEAGANVSLPVALAANGYENAVSGSLNFDPSLLSYTGVTLGSGASAGTLLVNTNQLGSGKLGVALALPTDTVFPAGIHELVRIGFTTAIGNNATVATLSFGDVPISRLVSGTTGNVLASTFTGGTVSIAAANYEGDVTPRPDGDRVANITDWVLEGRYAARLDYPTNATEFQRADCAPRATLGDGAITVTDWVQAGRYAAALDPLTPVGGPSVESPGGAAANGPVQAAGGDREVSVTNGMLLPSQTAAVGVQLNAQGNENALGFSLSYDPTKLTYAGATLGSGAGGATLNVNASQAGAGKLGIVMALGTGNSFAAGSHEVVKLNFTAATTATCDAVIALTDQPVPRQVSDPAASALPASYVNGTVAVNPLPVLGLGRVNDNIRLTWPLWASNYVMQASGSLAPGGWTNVGASVSLINSQHVVTQALSSEAVFYRLKQ